MRYLACIVKPHNSGLWSLVNKVITCLDIYEQVHVDWSSGCIYGDCWNVLFYPTEPPSGEHDVLTFYPNLKITDVHVAQLYVSRDQSWRTHYNSLWNRLKVQPAITAEVDRFCAEEHLFGENERLVSVMIRDHLHANEQVRGESQTLEEYAAAMSAYHDGKTKFFLMCRDWESIHKLSERFPCVIYKETRRGDNRSQQMHFLQAQNADDAKHCLTEILIASKAQRFIHPASNMATAVLYINPSIKSHFIA